MYTSEKNVYMAKVGDLFVKSVNLSLGEEIALSPHNKFSRYLNKQEKDFLLKHFPDATVKELTISDNAW